MPSWNLGPHRKLFNIAQQRGNGMSFHFSLNSTHPPACPPGCPHPACLPVMCFLMREYACM